MSETLDLDLQVYFVKKYVKLFQFIVTLPFIFPILNPLTTNVPHHIETSQLICYANHLTGFYIRAALALNGLKNFSKFAYNFPCEKINFSLIHPTHLTFHSL